MTLLSVGLGMIVCVCEPLHVCTFLTSFGALRVGDVVDAHAGHVVLRVLHAALRAVVAIAAALGGDEEQVAVDRRVALRRDARTTDDDLPAWPDSLTSQIVKPAKLPW